MLEKAGQAVRLDLGRKRAGESLGLWKWDSRLLATGVKDGLLTWPASAIAVRGERGDTASRTPSWAVRFIIVQSSGHNLVDKGSVAIESSLIDYNGQNVDNYQYVLTANYALHEIRFCKISLADF
jgi:hypothetical protein